jgi:adenylate cyclase
LVGKIYLDLERYYGGSTMKNFFSERAGVLQLLLVILLLVGLPIAVWLDLDNLAEARLHHQARDLSSMISSVRAYYATNVVDRVLASPGTTKVLHDYQSVPGAIPIPATLSLELGKVISEQQHEIK